jgi:hypothetical protein
MLKYLFKYILPSFILLFACTCFYIPRASVLCEGMPIAMGFPLVFYDTCAYNLRTGQTSNMLADLFCCFVTVLTIYTPLKLLFDIRPGFWITCVLWVLAGFSLLWITGLFLFIKWN